MLAKVGTRSGFTIVEVIVAAAIMGIVVGAIYSLFISQQKSFVTQGQVVDAQQHVRVAMELLTRECRMAGYNPSRVAGVGMVTATATEVRFTMDITGDGNTNGLNEDITYQLANGNLLRNGRALVPNVDAFNLVYLNADRNVLASPVNLSAIRSIQISLLVRSGQQDRDYTAGTNSYTNQQGQVIFTAPGDHFRRRLVSTEVKCRNLWRSV